MYGTISEADTYFETRLNADVWDNALASDKTKALSMATRSIDNLKYSGTKAVQSQENEFPRDEDTTVPTAIKEAAYEIALKLLDGVDLDLEFSQLGVVSNSMPMSSATYDKDFVQQHIRAGIPSIDAWRLLSPFLSNPQELTLSRDS